jgi:hypothetical protein
MAVMREVAQVVDTHVEDARIAGAPEKRDLQDVEECGKIVTTSIRTSDLGVDGCGIRVVVILVRRRRLTIVAIAGQLLEESGGRGDGHGSRGDIDVGHDGRDEGDEDLGIRFVRANDEEILRRKVVDANDSADIGAISQYGETHQLVVVPGVLLRGGLSS